TEATVKIEKRMLALPRRGIRLDGIEGEVPLVEDLLFKAGEPLKLVRRGEDNAYPQLRFADQHPFLSGRSFISVDSVVHPRFSGGPLAGNLRIEDNVLALDQFEMAVRGGRVTGQAIVNYDYPSGVDTDVQL